MHEQQRLDELINAHRALAARHEALFQTCKAMLALMPVSGSLKRMLMIDAMSAVSVGLTAGPADAEYQTQVQAAIEDLASVLPDVPVKQVRSMGKTV